MQRKFCSDGIVARKKERKGEITSDREQKPSLLKGLSFMQLWELPTNLSSQPLCLGLNPPRPAAREVAKAEQG